MVNYCITIFDDQFSQILYLTDLTPHVQSCSGTPKERLTLLDAASLIFLLGCTPPKAGLEYVQWPCNRNRFIRGNHM